MQTNLAPFIKDTAPGQEADAILRSCVHCGFCNATCPTYRLLGDELDGPRGRIYLIKQALEGRRPTARTQLHLDRCLTCRACETTCPSGVRYARLLDIGRDLIERRVPRRLFDRLRRRVIRHTVPYPRRFALVRALAGLVRPLLPAGLRRQLPPRSPPPGPWPTANHARFMLVLDGCVQSVLAPRINAAAARVLDRSRIRLLPVPTARCCGALDHHLGHHRPTLALVKHNIDAWWPHIENGAEAIVVSASGCAAMLRDYGQLLRNDPRYAARAERVSALARDISEVVDANALAGVAAAGRQRVAFHAPCTLQHALKLTGRVEQLLERAGFELTPVADAHICCGSAGTYSLLQPGLAARLRDDKLYALQAGQPDLIASANIGCLLHLATASRVPVMHWIELIDEVMNNAAQNRTQPATIPTQ